MRPTSGAAVAARVISCAVALAATLGYYVRVHAQGSTPTGTVVIPLRPLAPLSSVPIPPVFGLEGIIADKSAAVQLGKALFWDMQAGSGDTQACATCHFNAGADSRALDTVNPGQAGGDNTFQIGLPFNGELRPNYPYKAGSSEAGFGGYHDGDFPFHKLADPDDRNSSVISDVNDVSGSQGVYPMRMGQVTVGSVTASGQVDPSSGGSYSPVQPPQVNFGRNIRINSGGLLARITAAERNGRIRTAPGALTSVEKDISVPDPVFSYPDPSNAGQTINTRRVTPRNTPSVVDAVFNYRNFWDGRAQNICNGIDPFGARDKQSDLLIGDSSTGKLGPAFVSMRNSALCSQSLGPIVSNVEMSADGRDLRQVGKKLLARIPLAEQLVDPTDSVLGRLSSAPKPGLNTTYAALIRKAFLPEWWQFSQLVCVAADGSAAGTIDRAKLQSCPANTQEYTQMEYNFSLFWGVAIQAYESTLVADQTPLDKYLEQQHTYTLTGDNHSNSYTIALQPGITPLTLSVVSLNPNFDMSDQDVFAFDDGFGRFTGAGVDGTIDYSSGRLTVNFEDPPVSTVPIRIGYSVGPTPMTEAQLRGLLIFQTKGRCVVCHGGPELSNAAVDTVAPVPLERMIMGDLNVRVYDTGFYHIGVRPGAEDPGLGGTDPDAGVPLSLAEEMRQRVCKDASLSPMIPGRPGDGITQAPLNCSDDVARMGFFKTPQLRDVALTAPYFHDGSQLTLEQVVEFYNRGGDFNTVSELPIMDPDIEPLGLGLTLQEKEDLVDFLRNALTDPRALSQAAPFDHPQLFAPNGNPASAAGYPVDEDPAHPGQAKTQFMEIPAVGANGGPPLPTFLENILGRKNALPN